MGKIKNFLSSVGLRTGNTIATPLRISGEAGNAVANIPRQGISGVKNVAEVTKQTRDALVHNFTNFSKVEGKWYQKLFKIPTNLVSACTRRPAMIAGAGALSSINQGVRQPFKKLLYTPGKMFKGMRNGTRIFNKQKGFDFIKYDTHETTADTWVSKIKEKNLGFLSSKKGSSEEKKVEEKKPEKKPEVKKEEKKEEKKPEAKKVEEKKPEAPKVEEKKPENKAPEAKKTEEAPKSIEDIKNKSAEEAKEKDKAEQEKAFPEWKSLDKETKVELKKEYDKVLKNKINKRGIIARGKEAKMGNTPEEIMGNFKKIDPTFVGYMEEILSDTEKRKS
ncbi:MAG: hypothetical protein NTY80_05225 [candidate division SR1 bacterium]|nr:hypothetical protein [candidate division SR1 bacterium]